MNVVFTNGNEQMLLTPPLTSSKTRMLISHVYVLAFSKVATRTFPYPLSLRLCAHVVGPQ